jgi:YVTN family beta-propeller protein
MKALGVLVATCLLLVTVLLFLNWAGAPLASAGVSSEVSAGLRFTQVATITVGTEPHGVTVDTPSNVIYVANHASSDISVVNGSSLVVTDDITITGGYPDGIVYNPVDSRLYVGSDDPSTNTGDAYYVITPTTKIVSSPIGSVYNPTGMVVSTTGTVYIANGADYDGKANVTRHPGQLVVNSGDSGTDYAHMALDSEGEMYVTAHNAGNSGVTLVGEHDTNWPEVDLTGVSAGPWGIAWDSVDQRLYVASMNTDKMAVISTTTFPSTPGTILAPAGLAMLALDSKARLLFATEWQGTACSSQGGRLFIYDLGAEEWLATVLTLESNPDQGIAIDTGRRRLYVTNRCGNSLSVIEYGTHVYLPLVMKKA